MAYTIVCGLLGAVCWGVAPIFGKMGLRDLHPMDGLTVRTLITVGFVLVWAIASGAWSRLAVVTAGGLVFLGIESFLATLAGDLAYFSALKWGSASVAAVVLAASPIVTAVASRAAFGESLTIVQVIGIVLVGLGIVLVALGPAGR